MGLVDKAQIARAVGVERWERGHRMAWARAAREGQMLRWTAEERDGTYELYDIVDEVQGAAFDPADTPAVMMRKVYGQIERSTVESMLPRLRVDAADPRHAVLRERLADPFPLEVGWSLKRDAL